MVAATNCDLPRRIEEGKFREDLYYRLNVVPIEMPPLRNRREDVPMLAAHFVEKVCRAESIPLKMLTPGGAGAALRLFLAGNVRQLENVVEMAIALSEDRRTLTPHDFTLPPVHAGAFPARRPDRWWRYRTAGWITNRPWR